MLPPEPALNLTYGANSRLWTHVAGWQPERFGEIDPLEFDDESLFLPHEDNRLALTLVS